MSNPQDSHAVALSEPDRQLATWLTPQSFAAAMQIAELMATCGTLPKHLANKGDCFRVVVQAAKWRMDPFAVAECTSLVHGRMCYEGKLVAAVLSSMNSIEGRLQYDVTGTGQAMSIKVTGKVRGGRVEVYEGTVEKLRSHTWKDGKEIKNAWDADPHSMLIYRATRQWARLYAPEAIMGIYTTDEMEDAREVHGTVVATEPAQPTPPRTTQAPLPPQPPESAEVREGKDPKPAAAKASAHPAIEAARGLYKALGKDKGGPVVSRLAKLHGGEQPASVPADKLDAFGKDVAALVAAIPEPGRIDDLLSTWEQAAREAADEGNK